MTHDTHQTEDWESDPLLEPWVKDLIRTQLEQAKVEERTRIIGLVEGMNGETRYPLETEKAYGFDFALSAFIAAIKEEV